MRVHLSKILQIAPVIVLLLTAGVGSALVYHNDLSSWRVGTFGMFASVDNRASRRLEAYISVEGRTEPLDLSRYSRRVDELRILPAEHRLSRFLNDLACVELAGGADQVTLRYLKLEIEKRTATPIEAWRESVNECV